MLNEAEQKSEGQPDPVGVVMDCEFVCVTVDRGAQNDIL
jgi:hypothetical protein